MFTAALRAISDLLSPAFRSILWKALGMTVVLFVAILIAVEVALSLLTAFPWPWLETILAVAAGLGLLAAFVFLMAPVTAVFAGLFLDDVAALVERRDYAADPPGRPLAGWRSLAMSVQFGLLVLLVNLALLPTLFLGIGAVMMVVANAYLLSREYFTMVACRHMPVDAAVTLRRERSPKVFVAGFIPALLSLVPLLNVAVPLFSTAYFVHIYKRLEAEAAAHSVLSG